MSEPEPIDLSQLKNINLRPDWVEDLQRREPAAGEVIWGRAPGTGGGGESGGGGDRGRQEGRGFGPRREGGAGGPRGFDRAGGGPGGPRRSGPGSGAGGGGGGGGNFGRTDNRGPRPGGPGGGGPPRQDRGPRPGFGGPPGGGGGPGRSGPGGGGTPQGQGFNQGGPPRGERRDFQGGGRNEGGGGRPGFDRDRDPRGGGRPFREERQFFPLPGWQVRLLPEPRAMEAITRQIKASGRAYPVFELGRLFLAERDRYVVQFFRRPAAPAPQSQQGPNVSKNAPNTPDSVRQEHALPQPQVPVRSEPEGPKELFQCVADDSLWLSRQEAIGHLLRSPAFDTYYRRETVTVEPPKGNYTAIAICGFSGTLLGPPNHHAFQTNVARLHRERFANMPLDRYKARIHIEKDPAVLAKWQESLSTASHYIPLQGLEQESPAPEKIAEKPVETPADGGETPESEVPAEQVSEAPAGPAPLKSAAEMEAHFLQHHADKAVRAVTHPKVPGNIIAKNLASPLLDLIRMEVESQQRFPMQLVQDLCRDLEKQHLKFFKRDRKATFVSRSRPQYLENEEHLSPRIRSIVGIVRANPGISYVRLVSTLAPPAVIPPAPVAVPETVPASQTEEPAAAAENQTPVEESFISEAAAAAETQSGTGFESEPGVTDSTENEAQKTVAAAGETEAKNSTEPPVNEGSASGPDPENAGLSEEPVSADQETFGNESEIPSAAVDADLPEDAAPVSVLEAEIPSAAAEITDSIPESAPSGGGLPEPHQAEETATAADENPVAASAEEPASAAAAQASASAPPSSPEAPAAAPVHLSPEEIAVLQDIRWLVQEGFVTEFSNGELQILGRLHQPPLEKPEKKPRRDSRPGGGPNQNSSSPPPAERAAEDPATVAASEENNVETHGKNPHSATADTGTSEESRAPAAAEAAPGTEEPEKFTAAPASPAGTP